MHRPDAPALDEAAAWAGEVVFGVSGSGAAVVDGAGSGGVRLHAAAEITAPKLTSETMKRMAPGTLARAAQRADKKAAPRPGLGGKASTRCRPCVMRMPCRELSAANASLEPRFLSFSQDPTTTMKLAGIAAMKSKPRATGAGAGALCASRRLTSGAGAMPTPRATGALCASRRHARRERMPARWTLPGSGRPTMLSAALAASTKCSRSSPVFTPMPSSM